MLRNDRQGINDIPFGLGHLLAFFVPDHRVEIDFPKWNIPHKMDAHHNHSGHPEENDIKARLKNRSRVKGFQRLRFFRPTQG